MSWNPSSVMSCSFIVHSLDSVSRDDLLTRWQTEKMSAHVIMSFGIVFYIKRRISVPQSKYFSKLRIICFVA